MMANIIYLFYATTMFKTTRTRTDLYRDHDHQSSCRHLSPYQDFFHHDPLASLDLYPLPFLHLSI